MAVGGSLSVPILLEAYGQGVFPWPQEGYPLLWFCPDPRGFLDFDDFHVPKSLNKKLRSYAHLRISRNEDFNQVIQCCADQKRKGQSGTWISNEIKSAYFELHRRGWAHSWEVWDNDELVGGGYGVLIRGVFSGESLFHKKTDMSKLALIRMVEDLRKLGLKWMDTQMVTPLLRSFGAREISKEKYLQLLRSSQAAASPKSF